MWLEDRVVVRTDLVFERNRDELRFYQRQRTRVGCLLTGVVLVAMAGVLGYSFRDEIRALIGRIAPVVQSQARVVVGKVSILPLIAVVEQSELSVVEKTEWKDYLEKVWAVAEESADGIYKRQDIIELGRMAVETVPGLYYALREVDSRGLEGIGLDGVARDAARVSIREVTEDLAKGRLGLEHLTPLKGRIHPVLIDIKIGSTDAAERARSDGRRQELIQIIQRIHGSKDRLAAGTIRDMAKEMRAVLQIYRQELQKRK